MKKRLSLLMTLVIALCTSSAWAQSVVSVGTNLDFSEGTPVDNGICTYGKDMAENNTTYYGELAVDGWTAQPKGTTDEKGYENSSLAGGLFAYGSGHWLGGAGYNVPATNPEGVAEGNALGIIGVWSGTVQYVQAVTLEPGDYVISALVYNAVGGTTGFVKNLIGFIADNGTEYLASTKTYAVDTWTVENIKFTLTETTAGKLSLGYAAAGTGSGGNQHLFIDKVEVLAVTEADLARIDLNAALVSAQATVDAKVGVGAGVFMYSEEAYNAYAAAVAAAKAVSENAEATKDELVEALAALNAATAAYTVTVPAADAIYAVKFNGSDNYLTIGESTITIDAAVDTLSFEAVGNGKYYVHDNAGKYIYYSGTGNNIWSMSAAADKKDEWTISVNAEGLYTFVGKNGGIGVDGTEAGASCYGDKKGAAMALWTITEIVIEDEPGNEGGDDVVVAEGNLIENPGFEKWEGGNPVNWAGVGHNATIKQSADAKSGSYAVEVAGDAKSNKRLASQTYTLKAGTYKYSVNVKQTGDAAGMYRLGYAKVTDGKVANTSDYVYITEAASVSAEWAEASCEFTLNATTEIALIVMNSKNGDGASILVDDVALTTADGGLADGNEEGGNEEQKPVSGTIAEVVAAGAQASASTSGTVVATYARGFLIGDGTGYVLTYLGKDSGLAVGDVVTVAGATSVYGGLLQFGNTSTFEKTGTAEVTLPEPEVLDAAAMDAFIAAPSIKYVQYTGTLAISGNYYNVNVAGTETAIGSIQYPAEGMVNAEWNEKEITVKGFLIGVSSGKYVNTMCVSVVVAEEDPKEEEPTPEISVDVTDKVGTSKEAWNAGGISGAWDNGIGGMPEKYETTTATLGDMVWQTVEGLDNGAYTVELWANARYTAGRGFESAATDGQLECTFLFANNVEISIPVVYNPDCNNNTSHVLEGVIVTDGTLKMGMTKKADGSNWHTIQIKSLTYLGEASNDALLNLAKEQFTAAYDEFGQALTACQAMMLKMSFYEVDDAAYQLNAQLETTTDVDALNAMVETLAEATASLNEINEVYAEYNVFVQKFKAASEISMPKTTEAADLLEFNMYGGAGMQATSLEALAQAVQTIKVDYFTYIANAELLDGNMFDLTYLIQNPDFNSNMDGWTCVKAQHNGGEGYNGVGGIAEIADWGASSWDASISQAITNLPNGKYVVKAAWMAETGIQMTFAANAGETTVTGIGATGGNIAKDGSVVEMGQGHRGWQYVEVEGLVEDGTLTIAVNSSSAAQHMWSNADAFELYYAGAVVAEPQYLTIVGAMAGDVAIVEGAATVSSISTIDVTFDRPVALAENAGWATLADSWGPTNLKAEVLAENACVVRFTVSDEFDGEFTDAGEYILNIPEGFIVGAEDANYINAMIEAVITIEAAPATPLTVTGVTVGEDVMADLSAIVATPADMIKVNFDGQFYFQGMPTIVDAEGNDASDYFQFMNGMDIDGSNSYIFMAQNWEGTAAPDGIYTITLPKASFLGMMQWKAPAEDIVLTVQIINVEDGIANIELLENAVIYTITGKRVQGDVKSLESGIYIVNGRKVLVK